MLLGRYFIVTERLKGGLFLDITVSANAKLNLCLDITGIREDGYHSIETVMHSVDLRDSVNVRLNDTGKIVLTCDKPYIPTDEKNIAYKAAALFLSETGKKSGVRIDIKKRIPVGGGLGGSSTDGAAVLEALNYLSGKPYSESGLISLASRLGADVPFCIKKGAALCSGIGDEITSLPVLSGVFAVIIKPDFSLNTKEMYSLFDSVGKRPSPGMENMVSAVRGNDFSAVCKNLYNAFDLAAKKLRPEISRLPGILCESGAAAACMSGSGSCVFGLFDSMKKAHIARDHIRESGLSAFLTRLI